jgi:hypothetical protein
MGARTAVVAQTLSIAPLVGHRTQNFELARCLVGRGPGYALLFQRPVRDTTYEGCPVVAKPILEDIPPTRIVLAYLAGTNLIVRAWRQLTSRWRRCAGGTRSRGRGHLIPGIRTTFSARP